VTVRARIEGHVVDPVAAALNAVDYEEATRIIGRTAIHAVMKDRSSSDPMATNADLDAAVLEAISGAARSWGVVISSATLQATSS
jgi:metal-dependent amidase/aminoacylase/carboxypeptidase family protein